MSNPNKPVQVKPSPEAILLFEQIASHERRQQNNYLIGIGTVATKLLNNAVGKGDAFVQELLGYDLGNRDNPVTDQHITYIVGKTRKKSGVKTP